MKRTPERPSCHHAAIRTPTTPMPMDLCLLHTEHSDAHARGASLSADSPRNLPDTTARTQTQPPTSTFTKRASARSVRCTSSSLPARRQPRATADHSTCRRCMQESPSHPAAALSKSATAALMDFPLGEMLSEYGFGAATGVASSRVGSGRQPGYCAAHFPAQ